MSVEILKCCDETPEIFDFLYERAYPFKYLFQCSKCGFHTHSRRDWEEALKGWNYAMRRKL